MSTVLRFRMQPASDAAAAEIDWARVYAEELPRIYNFFRYRVGDDTLAEDLTSAAFERAWRARGRYRTERGAFSTWLFTLARNIAADHFRRRRDEVSLDVLDDQPAEHIGGAG